MMIELVVFKFRGVPFLFPSLLLPLTFKNILMYIHIEFHSV